MNITSSLPSGVISEPLFQLIRDPLPPSNPAPASVPPESSSSISPTASFLSQLNQLQQQSPAQYSNVASSIATQLQADATAAQNSGNTAEAKTLNQLATEFQNSAQSGQVPTARVLQQALAGHHHRHGHHGEATSSSSSTQTPSTTSSSPTSTTSPSTASSPSVESLFATAFSNAMNSTTA